MNLERAEIVLRPRSLHESMELALRWQTGGARRLTLRLSALTLLPSLLICLAARWYLKWEWIAVWLLAWLLTFLVQGVFTLAYGRLMFAPKTRTRDVLKSFVPALPRYLIAMTLNRVALLAGSLIVVGAPYVYAHTAFMHEVLLLERARIGQSFSRSGRLSSGQGAELAGMGFTLLSMCIVGATFAHQLGEGIVSWMLQIDFQVGDYDAGGSLWMLIGAHAVIPWVAATRYLMYIDGRTRRDGWDLQLRLQAVRRRLEQAA